MSNFHHGLTFRDGEVTRPLKTNSTNVIAIVGTAGMGPLNDPQLITSFPQAVEVFGPLRKDGFTLVKDLDDMFKQDNLRVLAVNVAQRDTLQSVTNEDITFTAVSGLASAAKTHISGVEPDTTITTLVTLSGDGIYTFPTGITSIDTVKSADGSVTYVEDTDYGFEGTSIGLLEGGDITVRQKLLITYTATLVEDVDYSYNGATGQFTRLPGLIVGPATITINYDYVDPSVEEADIVGEQGATIADNTGIYSVFKAISNLGLTPKLIGAPSHSSSLPISGANTVLAALQDANEKLGSIATTNTPNDLSDAIIFKGLHEDKRVYAIHTQHYKTLDGVKVAQNTAAIALAMFAKSDNNRKEGVAASPSNMKVNGVTELVNPVEFSLVNGGTQADTLNEAGISILINKDGFRLWGNRSTSADPAFKFINVIRVSDYVKDIISSSFLDLVDRNITQNFINILTHRVNNILKDLKASETINYGNAYENTTLNTPEAKQNGIVYIDYAIGVPGIAEQLIFTAHIVNGYVANIEENN